MKIKLLALVAITALGMQSCDKRDTKTTTTNTDSYSATEQNRADNLKRNTNYYGTDTTRDNMNRDNTNPNYARDDYQPDNSGINMRDRNNQALTAGDQSESEMDRRITQQIRRALTTDSSLSTNAKNIKIITIEGRVLLRGPVNSDSERSKIAEKAKRIDGVNNIENQLEVVKK